MNKFSFVTIIINNDVNEHSKHLESTNEPPFFFFFFFSEKQTKISVCFSRPKDPSLCNQ